MFQPLLAYSSKFRNNVSKRPFCISKQCVRVAVLNKMQRVDMESEVEKSNTELTAMSPVLPALVARAGERTCSRFVEFFTADIRNPGTRIVYGRIVRQFFGWCQLRGLKLEQISPLAVATYVEKLTTTHSAPTVKLHLAAIRRMFDFMVAGNVLQSNPAASVRGPRHVVKKGKTPVLLPEDARLLLDSIDTTTIAGLRDRALIGVMVYSFARVSAVTKMNVEDYFPQGRRMWFRLHEKGGKHHDVPAHHNAEAYVDDYVRRAAIGEEKRGPLFRSVDRNRRLTLNRLHRVDVLRMVKRRAKRAGLPESTCCHTFRATGITAYLKNGGLLEHAMQIACHESPRTTKLYDRTADDISLDEIEKILI